MSDHGDPTTAVLPASSNVIVSVRGLSVEYAAGRGLAALRGHRRFTVLDDVSLEIGRGEVVGLAGESGSGKSTLANVLVGLAPASGGQVSIGGREIVELPASGWRELRRRVQLIYQDPFDSLNPRFSVFRAVAEPLLAQGGSSRERISEAVHEALRRAELPPAEYVHRYPSQLSGGERQRVSIARALVLDPEVIVADEPVSMLDVTTGHQIVRLLRRLADEQGVSILLIGHDLGVLGQCCDRIGIMYLGRLVEVGPADRVLEEPRHPYTAALLAAIPSADPEMRRQRVELPGEPPSPTHRPLGCPFHPRCPRADVFCTENNPQLQATGTGQAAACWHPLDASDLP